MDRDTVTLLLIGIIILTAVLIAAYLVVPRLFRRGSPATAAAATTAGAGRSSGTAAPAATRAEAATRSFGSAASDASAELGRATFTAAAQGAEAATAIVGPFATMLTPATWSRVVADEDARVRRYRRPATVVMIEIDGLERLIDRLGDEAADRLIPAVADTIRRLAREADHVARLDRGRFAVLLPETDEVQAINYVERVRRTCDLWLEAGAVALRLAMGWASASGDTSLHEAGRTAGERMFAEIHRNARRSHDLVPPEPAEPEIPTAPSSSRAGRRS
jgi:diguanylate cyclase (GGDEF)-like protein